ncbi:MAG: hypothetical protein GX025_10310 [Clostridiales bacterium]|nr:hypothetical protein [Clostridiales bacterium]
MNKKVQYVHNNKPKVEAYISTEPNYFSITGTVFNKKDWETSGCIHDQIMEYFPELELLIDLHLNYLDGKPIYFIENSMYFIKNNNIDGLVSYGFNNRQAEYLSRNQPDEETFKSLVKSWKILEVRKYKAMLAMQIIDNLKE